jgi:hypothetical protein
MAIALHALGVSKRLTIGLVHFVDAIHHALKVGDIILGGLDVLEQTLYCHPILAEGMATRLETVTRSRGFR